MQTFLSVKEYATRAGIGQKTMRRFSHVKGFPALRIGKRIVIHAEAADAWLADYARQQTPPGCIG